MNLSLTMTHKEVVRIFANHILYISQDGDIDSRKFRKKPKHKLWQHQQRYISKTQAGMVRLYCLMVSLWLENYVLSWVLWPRIKMGIQGSLAPVLG